jgi:DNA-binding MarR family transcriptional regulator
MSKQAPPTEQFVRVAEFRFALRAFLRRAERVARECGLTPQRLLLLLAIKGAPDLTERATVTGLVDRLQLAQSTVTDLVSRAEKAGLVRREVSREDGRVTYISLTREGERRLTRAFRSLEADRESLREATAHLEDA